MTELSPQTQAIWNTYISGYSEALCTPVEQFDTFLDYYSKKIIASVLREVVKQYEYTHLYLDGDHGIGVVNVRDIIKICKELEQI